MLGPQMVTVLKEAVGLLWRRAVCVPACLDSLCFLARGVAWKICRKLLLPTDLHYACHDELYPLDQEPRQTSSL